MKNLLILKSKPSFVIIATIIGGLFVSETANATILTFSNLGLSSYGDIPGAYGDNVSSLSDAVGSYEEGNGFTPNISVDYRTVDATTGATISNNLDYWSTGYGDLLDVAFPTQNGRLGEISLTPEAGYFVKLNSFDLAGWPGATQPNQTVRILDGNFNILADYSPFNITGSGHNTLTPNIVSSGPILIQFGPSWNSGIDNINFDQVNAVPEPLTIFGAGTAIAFATSFKRKLGKAQKK